MNGIVAYASYIPYYRLDRKAIGETLGASAGSGTRSVACYDEDTTSMAVEAARAALRGASAVNWLQDVFPEIVERLDFGGRAGRLGFGLLRGLRNDPDFKKLRESKYGKDVFGTD